MDTQEKDQDKHPVLTVAISCIVQFITFGLGWTALPPLMPLIAVELSISTTMHGVIWGAFTLGVGISSPFGGAAVDRYGPLLVGALSVFCCAVMIVWRGMVNDAWSMAITMLIFGLATGFQTPTIPKVLAAHVRPDRLGLANGIALFAMTLGSALTMLIAATILAPIFGGWRTLQLVAGVAVGIVALIWGIFIRDLIPHSKDANLGLVMRLYKDQQLMRLTMILLFQFGGYVVMSGLLPRALEESGLSPEKAGFFVAVWLMVYGLANFVGPWLSDLRGRRRPFVISGSIVTGVPLAALALLPLPPEVSLWFLIVAGIGSGSFGPLIMAITVEMPSIGPQKVGTAVGYMFFLSQIGTSLLSVITGGAGDMGGLRAELIVLAFMHFAILFAVYGLRETGFRGKAESLAVTPDIA